MIAIPRMSSALSPMPIQSSQCARTVPLASCPIAISSALVTISAATSMPANAGARHIYWLSGKFARCAVTMPRKKIAPTAKVAPR